MPACHILAVDDERDWQFLLEKWYRTPIKAGELVIHYAPDAGAALACLDQHPEITIALCDINMPGMDGLTLLQHLVSRYPHVCPIMVTACSDMRSIRTAMNHGALDFLIKPVDFADLEATLRKAARQARRLRMSENYVRMVGKEARTAFAVIRDGDIVFVNNAWNAVFDEPVTRLIRSRLTIMMPQESMLSDDEAWFRWIAPELPELQLHHLEGTACDLYVKTGSWPTLWNGKPATVLIVQDVTADIRRQHREARYNDTLRNEVQVMRRCVAASQGFGEFIGKSEAMSHMYEQILAAAACKAPVMIVGETGTGKELAARMVHRLSDRSARPFIPLNCGAIPDTLFEREMFGHAKGAFTGAERAQPGWFEQAHQSTLFLDEVGELTPNQQVKFLRAIDNGEYCPVGSTTPRQADVRIVAATHRDVTELLRNKQMREDFFYRLHGLEITLPPLRDRKEDIPLLVTHFLAHADGDRVPVRLSAPQLTRVMEYGWPGNVRELQQAMQRYATTGHLTLAPPPDDADFQNRAAVDEMSVCYALQQAVEAFERRHILQTLHHHGGHRANTAAALEITERHLYRKIKAYGL